MTSKRKKLSSVSSSVIGSNHDILTEFLLFLPAKSLIRFQLVSKQWHSIISSPSFRRLHALHFRRAICSEPQTSFILRPKKKGRYLICNPSTKTLVPFCFGSPYSQYPHMKLLQSCNGLWLLECKFHSRGGKQYLVFNPTTMQSRNLDLDKPFKRLFLFFDPTKSPYYRVLCFMTYSRSISKSVYDSETHKWNDDETKSFLSNDQVSDGIVWNDGIYFSKSQFGWSRYFYSQRLGLKAKIDNPHGKERRPGSRITHDMVGSNGRMHCVSVHRDSVSISFHVSELSKDHFCWSTLCGESLNPIVELLGRDRNISVLGLIRGEEEEDSMLLFHVPGKIMKYKFVAKTFETVVDVSREGYFKEDRLQFELNDAHQLMHTLSPV